MSSARTYLVLILLVAGAVFTYAAPRLDLPKPRLIKVGSFPRTFAGWTAVHERQVEEDIQKALPTAIIVDRDYRNEQGRTISLLLLTAREMKDIHSPAVCLPGSGWQTQSDKLVVIDGQKITARVMAMRGVPFHVWFWYPPTPYPEPKHPFVRKLYRWRLTAPGTYRPDTIADLSTSLMVRVIAPAVPGSLQDVESFVHSLRKPLADLIDASVRQTSVTDNTTRTTGDG